MSILAIDTSSALTSVALLVDDEVVAAAEHLDPRRHVEAIGLLLARVRPLVDRSGPTAVACGVGPGPYTGLRVGIAAALALGAVWQVPVVGVCSLDAVAAAARAAVPHGVGVALDARRREVYWAAYDAAGTRVAGPRVGPAAAIDPALRDGTWVGAGACAEPAAFARVDDDAAFAHPHAAWVARLAAAALAAGHGVATAHGLLDAHGSDSGATADALRGRVLLAPRPLYLRRPDVTVAGGAA